MKRNAALALFGIGALVVAGCGSSATGRGTPGGKVVGGGTFTMALNADPGNLDPQQNIINPAIQLGFFAYDGLLEPDADGKIVSGLASAWKVAGRTVKLTIRQNVTCSDGARFTAADAAANLNYVADPKNKSPLLGVFLPAGAHAVADSAASTVTITLVKPAPFVLYGLANLGMVCAKGMNNRASLAHQTDGTGPYQLTASVPGNQYTYSKRAGYAWGPNGAATTAPGLPDKIVARVVTDQSTAANLLLSGGINAAIVTGTDAARLDRANLFGSSATEIEGEMWFNQASGRPGADKAIRQALTQAIDLTQLRQVLTSGRGEPPTTFAASTPIACSGNSIGDALPPHDLEAAKHLLDAAGWTVGAGGIRQKDGQALALTFVYDASTGPSGTAAVEFAMAAWKQLGVKVTGKAQDPSTVSQTVFGTGQWDIVWATINVGSPDQLVPFLSGTVPPGGTNFAHIHNDAYEAAIAKAETLPVPAGCPSWLSAETNIVRDVDALPFANEKSTMYGSRARFAQVGNDLLPTTIQMLGH